MATKLDPTHGRLFKDIFVCKNCSTKLRADSRKILEKKVRCRKCLGKNFRPIRKK